MTALDDARREAERAELRKLVRPEGHVFTRGEIREMSEAEYDLNRPAIMRQVEEGLVKP